MILDQHRPRKLPIAGGRSISVVPVPLRRDDPSSPWCYAASLAPAVPLDDDDNDENGGGPSPLPPGANFLATQVWPSSRTAAAVIEGRVDPSWTVCELGCGPGLPSLAAARAGARRVVATDLDEVALEMVRAAAVEQGFARESDEGGDDEDRRFDTMRFDLTSTEAVLPEADLYVLSDVFESSAVAEGAARHVQSVLAMNRRSVPGRFSRVWCFAQCDRAQREVFLDRMNEWYGSERALGWTMDHEPRRDEELWLFDLDETTVDYN